MEGTFSFQCQVKHSLTAQALLFLPCASQKKDSRGCGYAYFFVVLHKVKNSGGLPDILQLTSSAFFPIKKQPGENLRAVLKSDFHLTRFWFTSCV
ncbi:hypothetical protein DDZ16_09340 [Marinilabilia rubra]|uniref:Uncharacterized protein n=2 Tax=Marinilabilia rubra TaxID=2162893 RepID=A0A2U2B999_9BACT|nr:hypothetical protein DDZ16_09340 [Marinilabilia rubra]